MLASSVLLAAFMSSLPVVASAPPEHPQCLLELEAWTQAELAPVISTLLPEIKRLSRSGEEKGAESLPLPSPGIGQGCAETCATIWVEFVHSCRQPYLVRLALRRAAAHRALLPEPPSLASAGSSSHPRGDDLPVPPLGLMAPPGLDAPGAAPFAEPQLRWPPSAEVPRLERPPRAVSVAA